MVCKMKIDLWSTWIARALVLAMGALSFSACKKDTGVNQNLDPGAQTRFDFMSTKEGSWWRYSSVDTVGSETFTRYARNRDSVKNDLKYAYYERRTGDSGTLQPEYFGKNGDKYITLVDLDGTENSYLEYVYFINGSAQGTSFSNIGKVDGPGVGTVTIKLQSTVSETGLTMVFNDQTFTDVTHVHSDGSAGFFGVRIGTLDMWFKKDFGILKEEVHINVLGAYKLEHTDSLVSYHIVP